MKIYISPTTLTSYGAGNAIWPSLLTGSGVTKVYDDNPFSIIGSGSGAVEFLFNEPYEWDTTLGHHLQVLVEYVQDSSQIDPVNWFYDAQSTMPAYQPNQVKYTLNTGRTSPSDTLDFSQERKPQILIKFPRYDFELGVKNIYSLGRIPAPLGNPDTIKVLIENNGYTGTSQYPVYLESRGANVFKDSIFIDLPAGVERLFSFPVRNVTQVGMDTLIAYVPRDGVPQNDTFIKLREATPFTYSYRDLSSPPAPGGIGFNGATGDFVAKFQASQAMSINQIEVTFGFGNQQFKLGIWDASGPNGVPGNLLWESDTQTSRGNFVMPVWPPVSLNGNFFVGVRQIGTTNIAFGYQSEVPVRNGTFFFTSPTGGTQWTDFAPGAPFRFLIEPRIQAENDITPISVLYPSPNDTFFFGNFDSITPRALIRNIGSNDQLQPFETRCEVRYAGGQIIYSSSRFDTLSSGQTREIVFDSTLFPTFTGEYTLDIITLLPNDQFKNNDTLRSTFLFGKLSDVGPTTVFEPMNNDIYEFRSDTVYPTVKIDNFGFDRRAFAVTAEMWLEGDTMVWTSTLSVNIEGGSSTLASFDDFIPPHPGNYTFVVYTRLAGDTDRSNDTTRRSFRVRIGNDVIPNFAVLPQSGGRYELPVVGMNPAVNIKNIGEFNQTALFDVSCHIYHNNRELYSDTQSLQLIAGDSAWVAFTQTFNASQEGYYRARFVTLLQRDQRPENDTLWVDFVVGLENDIELVAVVNPSPGSELNLSQVYTPAVMLFNHGFKNQSTPFPVVLERIDSLGNILQTLTRMVTLDSRSTLIISFNNAWVASPEGTVQLRAYSALSDDEIPSNDTQSVLYQVVKSYDFELTQLSTPDSLLAHIEPYEPEVRITNLSRLNVDSAFVTLKIRNPNGIILYNVTRLTLPPLQGGVSTLVFPSFTPTDTGRYEVHARVFSPKDQWDLNDTAQGSFMSVLRFDAALVDAIPLHLDTLLTDTDYSKDATITVQNLFQEPLEAVEVLLTLKDGIGQELNRVKREINLDAMQTQPITFSGFLDPTLIDAPGSYTLSALLTHPLDQIAENNVWEWQFISEKVSGGLHSVQEDYFIKAYPNPFHEKLYVVSDLKEEAELVLYSATGKEVLRVQTQNLTVPYPLDTKNLTPGIYYLKVYSGMRTFAQQFIKY